MILFGDEAPETLTDYCYKIELNQVRKEITCDMKLCFDKQMYVITAVGDVVQTNLNELGHITIKFDGSHEPELPGTMYVEDKEMPHLRKGQSLKSIKRIRMGKAIWKSCLIQQIQKYLFLSTVLNLTGVTTNPTILKKKERQTSSRI